MLFRRTDMDFKSAYSYRNLNICRTPSKATRDNVGQFFSFRNKDVYCPPHYTKSSHNYFGFLLQNQLLFSCQTQKTAKKFNSLYNQI